MNELEVWMNEWMNGMNFEWINEVWWMNGMNFEWMNEVWLMNEWMNQWMSEWMNELNSLHNDVWIFIAYLKCCIITRFIHC